MEIYLVRHAVAEDRDEFAMKHSDDSQRPITVKGRKKLQKVAFHLRDLIGEVDLIVSSPYVRARQTADVLKEVFEKTKVVEAPELVPQSPPQAFHKWLRAHGRDFRSLLVVGHEPQLSIFGSYLLTGKPESIFEMKKAGVACFAVTGFEDQESLRSELRWLIPPKVWAD